MDSRPEDQCALHITLSCGYPIYRIDAHHRWCTASTVNARERSRHTATHMRTKKTQLAQRADRRHVSTQHITPSADRLSLHQHRAQLRNAAGGGGDEARGPRRVTQRRSIAPQPTVLGATVASPLRDDGGQLTRSGTRWGRRHSPRAVPM